jgi:hypothetical protein
MQQRHPYEITASPPCPFSTSGRRAVAHAWGHDWLYLDIGLFWEFSELPQVRGKSLLCGRRTPALRTFERRRSATCKPRTNAGARSNTVHRGKISEAALLAVKRFTPASTRFRQTSPSPQTLPSRAAPTTSSSYRSGTSLYQPQTHVLWCAQAKTFSGQNYYYGGANASMQEHASWQRKSGMITGSLQASLPDTDTRRPWEATVIATGHLYCGLRPDLLPFSYRCATSSSATPRRIWSADRGVAPSVRDPEPTRQPNADPYPTSRPT